LRTALAAQHIVSKSGAADKRYPENARAARYSIRIFLERQAANAQ
jgi:hypothetical protein